MQDGRSGASPTLDVASATAGDPGLGERAVFVDPTGGRHRRTRRIAVAVAVLCAGFVGTAALGLTGTGPLSGSPILTPVRSALDGLGVPHPDARQAETPVSAASTGPTEAARQSSTGGGRATAALGREAGPAATPSPSPTAGLAAPGRPSPPASSAPSPTAAPASARARPTTPGSDNRATPTPWSTSKPRGRPSPTPASASG